MINYRDQPQLTKCSYLICPVVALNPGLPHRFFAAKILRGRLGFEASPVVPCYLMGNEVNGHH